MKTIECPRCHGRVGLSFKDQTLEEALARHEHLTHAVIKPKLVDEPAPVLNEKPSTRAVRRKR